MEDKSKLCRLILAEDHIRTADFFRSQLSSMPTSGERWQYIPFCELVILNYCRPFSTTYGVGRLNKEWTKFADPDMDRMHKKLVSLRDTVVAHGDLKAHQIYLSRNPSAPQDGFKPSVLKESVHFDEIDLETIDNLCRFHLSKLKPAIDDLISKLYSQDKSECIRVA